MNGNVVRLCRAVDERAASRGVHPPDLTEVDQLLKEGDVLRWGRFEAQVIHTPGHTQGSVSLYLPQDAGKVTAARTITSLIDETGEKIDIADLLKKTVDPDGIRETEPVPHQSELILPRAPHLFSGHTLFAWTICRPDFWRSSIH